LITAKPITMASANAPAVTLRTLIEAIVIGFAVIKAVTA